MVLLALAAGPGCVGPVEVEGRPCPCGTGFTCCAVAQVCVADVARCAGLDADAGCGPDLEVCEGGCCRWTVTGVDPDAEVDEVASLRLDLADHPHLVYGASGVGELRYAWLDGSTWRRERIDAAADGGTHASLVLDASGAPLISYADGVVGTLRLAQRDAGQWVSEVADPDVSLAGPTSIALDPITRLPVTLYGDRRSGHLRVLSFTAGQPEKQDVSVELDRVTERSLGLGAQGMRVAAVRSASGTGLSLATRALTAWTRETVDADASPATVAFDSQAEPRLAYFRPTGAGTEVRVAHRAAGTAGTWDAQIAATGDVASTVALAFDAADRTHVAFIERGAAAVVYIRWTGSRWERTQVGHVVDGVVTLALDSAGRARLAYFGSPDHHLWFATYDRIR